jgi:hypothetical protein
MVEEGMERTRNLLTTAAFVGAIVGSAFAQSDLKGYKWVADTHNAGWKTGVPTREGTGRAQKIVPQSPKWVTISVNHVAQIDDLDKNDVLGKDRADFYALIWVDGDVYRSKVFSSDDGNPNWSLRVPVSGDSSTIRIRLMDDDGGLEGKDDHVDINPASGAKDLNFTFNSATHSITGDMTGTAGSWMSSSGLGDNDKGRITFSIS